MRDARRTSPLGGACGLGGRSYPGIATRLVAIFSALVILSAVYGSPARAANLAYEPRVRLPGHMLGALPHATLLPMKNGELENLDAPMTLTVVLSRSDELGFQQYLRDVYNPDSTRHRQFLSPTAVSDRFGPSAQDYVAVQSYFEQQGFTIVETSTNRLTLTVRGTRDQVENALAVRINDYTIGKKSFHANDRDPSLPASISARVHAVSGLTDLGAPRHNHETLKNVCEETKDQATKIDFPIEAGASLIEILFFEADLVELVLSKLAWVGALGFVCFPGMVGEYVATMLVNGNPKSTVLVSGGIFDRTLNAANQMIAKNGPLGSATGVGQRIGLVEFDTFKSSDVSNFITLTAPISNHPPSIGNLSSVHVSGGATLGAAESEVLLDIDTAMAVAPRAHVIVYDAPSSASYQTVFNAMINGGVTIISNSWASCEDEMSLAEVQSIDSVLATATASGISVFNGTGDSGSTCLDGSPNTVAVPADSPNATAVGGSSRFWTAGFLYGSETWWDGSTAVPPAGQGGFGVSKFFARPGFQNGFNTAGMRSVPDVVDNADPRMGMIICQADNGGCPTGFLIGGTSMSTPAWAGYAALMNEAVGTNLGAMNATLYSLANTNAFNNAGSMGSDFAHVGLGSPNPGYLKQHLLQQTTGLPDVGVSWAVPLLPIGLLRTAATSAPADGATAAGVRVTLWDANGNLVPGKTVSLTPNAGSQAVITAVNTVTSDVEGSALFTVTDLTPETITFTVTDATDNLVLLQTPSITFSVPPAVSAGIVASPSPVPANGTSTTTITVTLKDSLDRPTPGKTVTVAQGGGHSIITGPTPAVTDANGQIAFTATDTVAETVTYTAVDESDGELPIPGSPSVQFTGGAISCLPAPPTPATGFTLTPFANGFLAQNFFFGGISFTGCPGASNPVFDTTGSVLVSDFPTGDFYKFGASGGAVSTANKLSNLGKTFGSLVFGKDGSLYGTTFSPAAIVQVDRVTGAVVRTVASGFACPYGLSVDPLSGDLFFDDNCVGGIQNASLWRIQNPSSVSPTVVVYATLPGFGNGQIAFSPDGTMYVVCCAFNNPNAPVLRISGTNTAAPHTPVAVSGITADTGGVAIGELLANGAAKSLIVHAGGAGGGVGGSLKLIDLSTLGATLLADGLAEPGVVGLDGCMYVNSHDTILKLAPTSGACSFKPSNPSPLLALTPATISPNPAQGTSQTFTATFQNISAPLGTPVLFRVTGANPQVTLGTTDANGAATFSYTGIFTGDDKIIAASEVGNTPFNSNQARLTWGNGAHVTSLTLNQSPSEGAAGRTVTVLGSLVDVSVTPNAPVSGATIAFSIGNQSCNGVTNAQGVASCTLTVPSGTALTLTASFTGNGQDAPTTASELFRGVAASPSPPKTGGAPAPIPTLNEWMLALLSALVLLLGAAMRRSR